MASSTNPDPEREYRLIEQLELRIGGANTSEKLESILQRFLAALVLKLGSETPKNRNLAIKVCQYVNSRVKIDNSISLPVQSLSKTFRESQNVFVKRFALLFVEQGLGRLKPDEATTALPKVLQSSIPKSGETESVDVKMWSIAFDFLLTVLRTWRVPDHTTKEDIELANTFESTTEQCLLLSQTLSHFLLYDPKVPSTLQNLSEDFKPVFEKHFKTRSQVTLPIARFLFTSIFSDEHRLVPATILSVDANASASSLGDAMFKQCNFDLESDTSVNDLFTLYDIGKPKLQTKILTLLNRSQTSTLRSSKVLGIVEKELFNGGTGLEAAKLRAAIFTYLNWAVRVSTSLDTIRERLQTALREFIELQGWPTMSDPSHADIDLRAKAYESIGLLAAVKGSDTSKRSAISFDLVAWLFTSLRCDITKDVRGSIDESLSRVLVVISMADETEQQKLKDLLLWNITANVGDEDPVYFLPTKHSTKYPAVRFANKVLSFSDVDARYIDILALGARERRELAEEGARGLDPYWHVSNARLTSVSNADSNLVFPDFDLFVKRAFGEDAAGSNLQRNMSEFGGAVIFARNILIYHAFYNTEHDIGTDANWKERIDALVTNTPSARHLLRQSLARCDSTSLLRLLEASVFGLSSGSGDCADIAFEISSLAPNSVLAKLRPEVLKWCQTALLNTAVQTRASRVYGIVSSLSEQGCSEATDALAKCTSWKSAMGQDAIAVRGMLLCAGSITSRTALRGQYEVESSQVTALSRLVSEIVLESSDKDLKQAAYSVIAQLCLCFPSKYTIVSDKAKLIDAAIADAKKETEAAVSALGCLIGHHFDEETIEETQPILDKLFALHDVRKAEFQFALGESFAVAALGFRSTSTISEFDVEAILPEHGYHVPLFNLLIEKFVSDCKTTKPSLKKAAAIWLLSLIQFCDNADLLKSHLRDCQAAFGRLLTDRDEIVQETGSRGLSLVYEKGDKNLRDDLVRDLVQSFTGGSAKMAGTVNEDTQLFEAGALPTEKGESVKTYKDIVSLATEMGDPSLVYRFMNLASNNAIWTSRAAFGRFGLSGVLADSTYLTENKKFYPKLYRYRFDPNPNVQRSMDDIWKALVKDPNKVIEENFDAIMEDLLASVVSGKEWRSREASCAAISDLVQGREVEKFEKYLDDIWKVAFKVLDDVKETVRLAAMKLCRTLTGMLIRNLEVGEGSTKRATAMLNHAIPFLLQQMEGGSAQEVQQYAVVTLLEVVKKSPPKTLQQFAPVILEKLILSLSSLEHESINYLHLNADKYGLTAEKLDKMRVSSINASPVTEAIERCLESLSINAASGEGQESGLEVGTTTSRDVKNLASPLHDAMQRLEKAFKSAIGLPSKVGLSRVIVTLVVRHHAMFRPFADRFIQLTRKYILDRNATISVSFSMALAYLMRLATEKEVHATSQYAQQLYFESQELAHRAVAGEIVQAISKASNDIFMNFATVFLPFAFIGRNDTDSDVCGRFDPPWKDNIGGSRALQLYLPEIVDLLSSHIKSSLWPIRHACCLAVAELVSSMEVERQYSDREATLLWGVVEESLNGKTWEGKEKVVSAYPRFVERAKSLWPSTSKQMRTIAIREAKRNNIAYRPHALIALGRFRSIRRDLELDTEIMDVLTNAVETLADEGDVMDVDEGGGGSGAGSSASTEATWCAIVKCVFQVLSETSSPTVLDRAVGVVKAAHGIQSTKIDIEIYDGSREFITTIAAGPSGSRVSSPTHAISQSQASQAQAHTHTHPELHPELPAGENQHALASAPEPIAAFFEQLVLATLHRDCADGRHTIGSEKLRKSRADCLMALADGGHLLHSSTRNILAADLVVLQQSERSRPLRTLLEKAVDMLRILGSTHQ